VYFATSFKPSLNKFTFIIILNSQAHSIFYWIWKTLHPSVLSTHQLLSIFYLRIHSHMNCMQLLRFFRFGKEMRCNNLGYGTFFITCPLCAHNILPTMLFLFSWLITIQQVFRCSSLLTHRRWLLLLLRESLSVNINIEVVHFYIVIPPRWWAWATSSTLLFVLALHSLIQTAPVQWKKNEIDHRAHFSPIWLEYFQSLNLARIFLWVISLWLRWWVHNTYIHWKKVIITNGLVWSIVF